MRSLTDSLRRQWLGLIALCLAVSGVSFAAAQGPGDSAKGTKAGPARAVINACANRRTGVLRVRARAKRCRKSERAVSWAAAGATGAAGPAGATGPAGPPGGDASVNGVAAGGDLGGTYPDPIIAGGAVTGPKLATAAVTTGKLADGAVTATKYGTAVVRTATAVIPSEGSRSANAPCAAGERAVAGGGSLDGFAADINLISSRPAASGAIFELPANGQPFDAWRATAIDTAAGGLTNVSVRAHVVCLQ